MKSTLVLVCGLLALSGLACSNNHSDGKGQSSLAVKHKFEAHYPIKVVCTTGMIADLARNIGGSRLQVEYLIQADPHTYEATPGDTRKLEAADLILYSGLHLEGKMADILKGMSATRPAFAVAEHVNHDLILKDDDGEHDPHIWFDVSLWSQAAGVVRDILMKYDAANAAEYRSAAEKYQARLALLHEKTKNDVAAGVPKERRVLVTSHDAFRYFGRAYDIEVRGIQGISTEAEASPKAINDLAAFLGSRKIKAVFVETSVNPSNMKQLIRECAARGHSVREGGVLFSDAMGRDGTREGTYIGMIEHNVRTIIDALK